MSMNAAVLYGIDDLSLTHVPVPEPGPGEVLFKVKASAICGTDLRIASGAKTAGVRPGVILGHEFAGRVAATGEGVEGVDVGVQVMCSIVLSYGRYPQYLAGHRHLCEDSRLFGYEIGGGLAEYLLVSHEAMERGNLVFTPCEFEPTALALVESVGCYLNGVGQFRVSPGEAVVVLGTGPIGLLYVTLAKPAGATRIVVVGRPGCPDPALAPGATCTLASQGEKLTHEILDATGGGANVAVVAVGDPALANQVLEVATIGGRVSYFAGFPKGSTAVMEPNIVHCRELQMTGGSDVCRADVHRAVELLSSGAPDVGSLVTHRLPLIQIDTAIAAVHERAGPKVAVMPD